MSNNSPGKIKRAAQKVAGHVKEKREFQIPTWLIYIALFLGAAGVIFGIVQQARIWRWDKILKGANVRIAELKAEKDEAELKATKKVASGQLKLSQKKIVAIDHKIKEIEKAKAKIIKKAERMDPLELRNAFRYEGFGYASDELKGKKTPTSRPVRRSSPKGEDGS